ncbi:MAG: hypothetical protein AAB838_03250 [Patescibacteria group bacterium]
MSSVLDNFLTPELKSLLVDGDKLLNSNLETFNDYSFLVFNFSKAYEGFLKLLFLKMGIIRKQEYESDHWRVGKALSPHMHQVYDRIGPEFAERMWQTWKRGRNSIFHFYPHRLKILTLTEARDLIAEILMTMEFSVSNYKATDQLA